MTLKEGVKDMKRCAALMGVAVLSHMAASADIVVGR